MPPSVLACPMFVLLFSLFPTPPVVCVSSPRHTLVIYLSDRIFDFVLFALQHPCLFSYRPLGFSLPFQSLPSCYSFSNLSSYSSVLDTLSRPVPPRLSPPFCLCRHYPLVVPPSSLFPFLFSSRVSSSLFFLLTLPFSVLPFSFYLIHPHLRVYIPSSDYFLPVEPACFLLSRFPFCSHSCYLSTAIASKRPLFF